MKREITLKIILFRYVLLFFAVLFVAFVGLGHCQVSPILGNVGNIQVFDNFGNLCPQCVLYSYVAGTTTQQATFTDSTGTVQNSNPITFNGGGRAAIWLTTGAFYKLVLCAQNDGSFCAPADVLFSSDQVPGGATGGGGGGGGAPFISNSANPATSGILRLASGDSICWRNAANSANLCVAKDTSDVLNWAGGAIKFPEIACSNSGVGFDYWCADSSTHHWKFTGNGGSQFVSPGVATAGTSGHVVTFAANGLDLQDGGQSVFYQNFEMLMVNQSSFVGTSTPVCALTQTPGAIQFCAHFIFANAHTLTRFTVIVYQAAITCTTNATVGIKDLTSGTVLLSSTPTAVGTVTVTGSVTIPAGDEIGVGLLSNSSGCAQNPGFSFLSGTYQ